VCLDMDTFKKVAIPEWLLQRLKEAMGDAAV
jgi:acyl-CoA thioesterase FadM